MTLRKNKQSVLYISVVMLLAITVTAFVGLPSAEAKSDKSNGQPDFVAELVAEGTNDAKGHAWFWFDNDLDPTSLKYKIVLNKVDVGQVEDHTGTDKNKGKGLEYFVEKLHIHAAPGKEHSSEHLLNVIGPDDDRDLIINGHIISGIWDDDDAPGQAHHASHQTKALTNQIEPLCAGETDVNVHLNGENQFIRGLINPNSETCSNLFPNP